MIVAYMVLRFLLAVLIRSRCCVWDEVCRRDVEIAYTCILVSSIIIAVVPDYVNNNIQA